MTNKQQKNKISLIGHRGARGYEPENTMISFLKAIELGCDYIEFDVHLSKDNVPVVIHDNKVERTCNGEGKIKNKTLKELKELQNKEKNQNIPTVEEVIKQFKGKTKFMIEIKGTKPTKNIIELIKKYKIQKDSIIISFKPKALIEAKKIMPEIKTALLWDITSRIRHKTNIQNKFKLAKKIGADAIYPYEKYISKRFVKTAKKYELEVYTYIANDEKTVKRLIDCGVDMIESDYPDIAHRILNQKNSEEK